MLDNVNCYIRLDEVFQGEFPFDQIKVMNNTNECLMECLVPVTKSVRHIKEKKKISLYLQGACTLWSLSPNIAKNPVRFLQHCKKVCGWEDCVLISIS